MEILLQAVRTRRDMATALRNIGFHHVTSHRPLHVQNRQIHNMCILCYYKKNFFDPEADFQVHRRNLPHRRQAGVTYFVTFHLADSLPGQKLAALEEQRKLWLAFGG
jgi:hypothetical protein